MDVAQAIRGKHAVRSFLPAPIPDDVARAILNAGRRAQSSKNSQPWQFIAVRNRPTLELLARTGRYAGHIASAAMAVVIATPDPARKFTVAFDAGQAAAYMQLAAWELGVGSCLASLYFPAEVARILAVPDPWQAHVAVSFGYFDPDKQPPSGVLHPGRKSLDEIVHWEKW
jgi:nitroreductase